MGRCLVSAAGADQNTATKKWGYYPGIGVVTLLFGLSGNCMKSRFFAGQSARQRLLVLNDFFVSVLLFLLIYKQDT